MSINIHIDINMNIDFTPQPPTPCRGRPQMGPGGGMEWVGGWGDINMNIHIHIIINMNRQYWYPQVALEASSRIIFCVDMPFFRKRQFWSIFDILCRYLCNICEPVIIFLEIRYCVRKYLFANDFTPLLST